ncbi:Acyl-CoA dehydrogenase domain protein [Mesorhizobium sp. SOD10]|nr:Acyl-CoA dehydrogenase domain protein [Mesorhizobium sp. SOD10]
MNHSDKHDAIRKNVRAFIAAERTAGRIRAGQSWTTFDRDFSIRCADQGYIGMTWPKMFGGHDRSPEERYVVIEELLAAGAPLGSHWIADRQSGPQILRNGTEHLKHLVLPQIAAGRCTIGIGMSEPDSGSDLSSIRTSATKVDGGWVLEGRKIWTTNAHHADYLIVLCRTSPKSEDRNAGLSQLVVPLENKGVTVRPITNMAGVDEFNEVLFENCFVDEEHLLGEPGQGWRLVMEELSFERSGPDRILSTFPMLSMLSSYIARDPDRHATIELGRLVGRLHSVRSLSLEINQALGRHEDVGQKATMMKDIGTTLEQDIAEVSRRLIDLSPRQDGDDLTTTLASAILNAPSFSLRGGTREILKGIVARHLGLR